MSMKELALRRSDVFWLDPRVLKEKPGFNVRYNSAELDAHIRRLADSIKERGVKVPLEFILVDGEPYVTAGHCRLAATMLAIKEGADIKAVPCVPEAKGSSEEERTLNLILSNEGKPLTILEMAEVFARLTRFGWTNEQIGTASGYSRQHIANCLMLLGSDKEIKDLVVGGRITASAAIKLIQELGEKEALAQMKGAVKAADELGKKGPVSRKDTAAGGAGNPRSLAEKRVNWKEWGPKLHHALEAIVTCPVTGKGSENLQQYLSDGNELISQMEDEGYTGKA